MVPSNPLEISPLGATSLPDHCSSPHADSSGIKEEMDPTGLNTFDHTILILKKFLEDTKRTRSPSEKTRAKYLANYISRRDRGLLNPFDTRDEGAPAKRSCLFNRAALVFSVRYFIERWLKDLNAGLLLDTQEDIEAEALRWLALAKFVLKKAPPGERIDKENSLSRCSLTESASKPPCIFKKKTSKRDGMASLPDDWCTQMALRVCQTHRYADHLAILELTGARPAEFANGIEVRLIHGALEFNLVGAKVTDTTGIEKRVLRVICGTLSANRLASKLQEGGPSKTWICKAKAISAYVSALGKKVFPRHKYKISPYTYRHALASDQKSADVDREQLAASMGHRSTRTAGVYGRKKTKRKVKPANVSVVKIVGQVRQTHNQPPDFVKLRESHKAKKAAP